MILSNSLTAYSQYIHQTYTNVRRPPLPDYHSASHMAHLQRQKHLWQLGRAHSQEGVVGYYGDQFVNDGMFYTLSVQRFCQQVKGYNSVITNTCHTKKQLHHSQCMNVWRTKNVFPCVELVKNSFVMKEELASCLHTEVATFMNYFLFDIHCSFVYCLRMAKLRSGILNTWNQ